MNKAKIILLVIAAFLVSCSITQAHGETATESMMTRTPSASRTKTMTCTTAHTATLTNTRVIPPTKKPTSTQSVAQDLGTTIDEVKEAFADTGFAYTNPTEINGLEYVKGQATYGRMLELYAKNGRLINAEASVENHGPQTNPSILFQLLEAIQKDPERKQYIEQWLQEDAPGGADASPLMEVTYIDKDNIFYTYARDEGYTRIYLKIYVLTWLIDMDIVK